MDSTLRPMSTSQVLDRTFFLYRKNFALFAGVAAVTPALSILLQLAFVPLGFPPQNPQATGNLAANCTRPSRPLPDVPSFFFSATIAFRRAAFAAFRR